MSHKMDTNVGSQPDPNPILKHMYKLNPKQHSLAQAYD